jgi:hypothetical protein
MCSIIVGHSGRTFPRRAADNLESRLLFAGSAFSNARYDLIDPLDLPLVESKPLDRANAINLSGSFEDSGLLQKDSNGAPKTMR